MDIIISNSSSSPIYEQITRQIKDHILQGELKAGDALPSMRMLAKEFITPIDREDILELAHELDEVTDHIDETMTSFYMFHVAKPRPEALTFADTIFDCCTAMHKAIVEFKHFRKSSTLHEDIVSIHTMREQADALYTKAIHNLYSGSADPIEVIVWTEIFGRFERCSKSCEEVAKVVESVIMKNS